VISYELVLEPERLGHIANEIDRNPVLGLDIEATSLSPHHGDIRLVQLNTGQGIYVIDLFATKTLGPVLDAIRSESTIKVIQHGKFEQSWFLQKYDCELWPLFDTFRSSAMIHNGKNLSHGLYDLYSRELKVPPGVDDMSHSDWGGELNPTQLEYAAEDVTYLLKLRESLKPKLAKAGLNKIALLEFGAIIGEARIETNGFALDSERWLKVAEKNKARTEELRVQLDQMLPHPKGLLCLPGIDAGFNLNSPQQVLESFQRLLGKKTPLTNTRSDTFAMIATKHKAIPVFMEYRTASKRVNAFGPKYLEHLDPVTGRIHTSFWPLTGAGRYSSGDPNLQQIPREFDYRDCFRPGPGRIIVVCDYGQIELRIAAEITQDPTLKGIYLKGEDAHRRTASLVSGKAYDEVTKGQRQAAKPVNFGLIYGLGADSLVVYSKANYNVTISLNDAKRFIKKYFEGYPRVRAWQDRVLRDAKRAPFAKTIWGRRRFLDPEKKRNEFYNCLDFETEALTRRGWVRGPDLTMDDEILTKNPASGVLEWQAPSDLRVFAPEDRELVEFKSRSFHAVSTDDHRWWVYSKGAKRDVERRTSTISRHGDDRIHRTGRYVGPESGPFSDDFVELAGWWLTDGGIQKTRRVYDRPGKSGPKPSGVSLKLYQSETANAHKAARIESLLGRMGIEFSKHPNEESGVAMWYFRHPVNEVLVELCPQRLLTMDLLNHLPSRQCHLLLRTMIDGDGWRSGKTGFVCRKRAGAEAFQILCTLCGAAASIVERDMRKYRPRSGKLKNVPKGKKHWQVTVLRRDKVQVLKRHVTRLRGRFGIWCPIVPNTFFVARRSGHVFVTGNTPVQGTGADGLKRALRNVYYRLKKYGKRAQMVHMVHDEIVVECDDDPELVAEIKPEIEQGMIEGIQPMLRTVPVTADADVGPSWAAH